MIRPIGRLRRTVRHPLRILLGRRSPEQIDMVLTLTDDERQALENLIRLGHGTQLSLAVRQATDEEVAEAAWGNLNIEEPDVTLEDARRIILGVR